MAWRPTIHSSWYTDTNNQSTPLPEYTILPKGVGSNGKEQEVFNYWTRFNYHERISWSQEPWGVIEHLVTSKEIILNDLVICTHSQVQIQSNPSELPAIVAVSWTTLHLVILGKGGNPTRFSLKKTRISFTDYKLPLIRPACELLILSGDPR